MPESRIKKEIKLIPLKKRTNWPDAMTLLYMEREDINVNLCKLENCDDFNVRGTKHRYYGIEHCKICKKENPANSSRPNVFNSLKK
ncbi:MAG: hypothetical protein QG630_320 [Patescibacteria group bacterium]|nr:hypothetical protein [Patescibacteria group bacterium]